jgi:uncharacterized protein YdeI (YjbR/CyaY-like superfamily)
MRAAAAYSEMKAEVARAIEAYGTEAFRIESLRPWLPRLGPPGAPPFYETYGEQQVSAGRYTDVLRYERHVRPVKAALLAHYRPPTAQPWSDERGTDAPVYTVISLVVGLDVSLADEAQSIWTAQLRPVSMTAELMTLQVRSRRQWRAWLAKHHTSSPGVWLVFYKAHTGVKSIHYEDTVREALCFGWIDSLIKRLDDERYALKVTPRQPTSKWSDINRKRWAELKAAGLLTSAGLAAAPTNNSYAPRPVIPDLPVYIAKALKANSTAWEFFRELAPTYRRDFVVWIHTAKRAETRERRIRESIALLVTGKKLGLK